MYLHSFTNNELEIFIEISRSSVVNELVQVNPDSSLA